MFRYQVAEIRLTVEGVEHCDSASRSESRYFAQAPLDGRFGAGPVGAGEAASARA
jgi:hypothetical protein